MLRNACLAICAFVFASILWPLHARAWSEAEHHLLTQKALEPVAASWNLNKPVAVHSFDQFLKAWGIKHPEIKTREAFAQKLAINPQSPFDQLFDAERTQQRRTPLQILTDHAIDPDDGRDQNLPIAIFKDQFWFGGGTGVSTQAFRHIEKPPWAFGFPFRKLGEATDRIQIYFDLAQESKKIGENYWAWRFLACALHYVEDLNQPYHAAQASPQMLWLGLKAYATWGRTSDKGILGTIAHLMSNTHLFFEAYTEWQSQTGMPVGLVWNRNIAKQDTEPITTSVRLFGETIRDRSHQVSANTMAAVIALTQDRLLGPASFIIDKTPPDDPRPMIRTDLAGRTQAASQLNKIIGDQLTAAGMDIRSLVWNFVQ